MSFPYAIPKLNVKRKLIVDPSTLKTIEQLFYHIEDQLGCHFTGLSLHSLEARYKRVDSWGAFHYLESMEHWRSILPWFDNKRYTHFEFNVSLCAYGNGGGTSDCMT